MEEVWKPVPGFEGYYEVSNYCRYRSVERTTNDGKHIKGQILKQYKNKSGSGYPMVKLSKNGVSKGFLAHRLMMQAFVPNPFKLPCVNHKNEFDKTDNFIFVNTDGSVDLEKSSLEWCSYEYNNNYGTRTKRACVSKTNGKASKKIVQYDLEGGIIKIWPSINEIKRILNYTHISDVCKGVYKQAYGFIWRYL